MIIPKENQEEIDIIMELDENFTKKHKKSSSSEEIQYSLAKPKQQNIN